MTNRPPVGPVVSACIEPAATPPCLLAYAGATAFIIFLVAVIALSICGCVTPSQKQCIAELSGERAAHAATWMLLQRCQNPHSEINMVPHGWEDGK